MRRGARRGKKKSTVEAIEELRRNREERRKSAEQFKRARADEMRRNEALGKPGDVDFQRMIQNFRAKTKLNKRSHKVLDNSNINICVRKRPIIPREVQRKDWDSVTCLNPITMVHQCQHKVDGITKYLDTTEFSFDHSFDESDDNAIVYKCTARPLIPFVLSGGNATVFAYGQTGSGKTYTMTALSEMAAADIFRNVEARHQGEELSIFVSFFEIYGGRCIDLLNRRSRLSIREDGRGSVVIGGLREEHIHSSKEMLAVMRMGHKARATSRTEMNEASSRSHAICQVVVRERSGTTRGKFSLIDLAGSERAADTKNHNRQRRVEGAEINKSLLALKECIRALDCRSRGHVHVPYRASKLTLVLKDSFAAQSRTVMICNISPGASAAEHTLNTLRYADRVKQKEVKHAFNLETTMPGVRGADDADDDVPEAPMSPMGRRLSDVQKAARQGRISAAEKARIKDQLIAQQGRKRRVSGGGSGGANGIRRRDQATRKVPEGRPPQPPDDSPNVTPVSAAGAKGAARRSEAKTSRGTPASSGKIRGKPRRRWAHPAADNVKENEGRGRNGRLSPETPPRNMRPEKRGNNGRRGAAARAVQQQRQQSNPVASPHNQDLEIMHRSLRANRDDREASAELLNLHETVSKLVEEEENLLQSHMESIQENAELLTEEGRLLAKVQGEDVVDYDIDLYAERLDQILAAKINMYQRLHNDLKRFRQHLADEEAVSKAVNHVQMY